MAARRGPYRAKAVRLAEAFAGELRDGRWDAGAWLPAEHRLAARFGVARETLRNALARLIEAGLLTRVPHRGVQVRHPTAKPAARLPTRRIIAAVGASRPDEGMAAIRAGIEDYAREHGFDLHVLSPPEDVGERFTALEHAAELGVHGAIVLPYPGPDRRATFARLAARGLPIVCVERRDARLDLPSVEVDDATGMYRATHHLLARHRRPAWYLGMTPAHRTDRERYAGWRRAMVEAGYGALVEERTVLHEWTSADPRYWHVDEPWRQGWEVAQRLLAKRETHWSVACQKDDIAWGLHRACAERGLAIGKRVAITGFDDLSIASRLDPPLTTVRQPFRQKGAKAAWLLDRLLAGASLGTPHIVLPVELVERGSA